MRGKAVIMLLALALTVAVALSIPRAFNEREGERQPLRLIRVWSLEKDTAVNAWLRERAAAYERQSDCRVYLRGAAEAEREGGAVQPDVMILPGEGSTVALRGWALIVRDDTAAVATPAPTSALFIRPSAVPGPSPPPAPAPDWAHMTAVLTPAQWLDAVPGAILSADPASDLARGRARAAVLTAGQASALPFGFRAYPLPGGFLSVGGQAMTEAGEAFLRFLRMEDAQQALKNHGLYSPVLPLYGPEDPIRSLIEGQISRAQAAGEAE